MDEEQGKKKRGRRKGGKPYESPQSESTQQSDDTQAQDGDITADTAGDVTATEAGEATGDQAKTKRKRSQSSSSSSPDVSPMDFWRSGQPRTHRTQAATAQKKQGVFGRVRNMYLPPWVPVVGIIFVVFGVLALLFITRSVTGAPRISDHWHATYTYFVCGEKQPNAPTWEGVGVHTHGDGVMHIHPFTASEEGSGARLVKWFDYGGGKLDDDEIRMPGSSVTYKNGDECPDGTTGEVQVTVNSQKLSDWSRYIPKDGDRVRMDFGPPQDQFQLEDRIVLPEEQATRTVEVNVAGNESETAFDPASLQLKAGETVKVVLKNTADVSHGMRFAGTDNEYDTGDDFVVVPAGSDPQKADQGDVIQPGGEGFAVIRFDEGGESQFKDPTASNPETQEPFATGTVVITDAPSATPVEDVIEQETDVVMKDNVFEPGTITLAAGKEFRINLDNQGKFAHNLRIAGLDGEFETDDDIVSPDVPPGEKDDVTAQIDEPGEYAFRDDFHPDMTGTLTIE
ncbi:MAG: cupredoxin domain-containing protein [Dehalococcoidia bacterium]